MYLPKMNKKIQKLNEEAKIYQEIVLKKIEKKNIIFQSNSIYQRYINP
jgi:hypothetical protein